MESRRSPRADLGAGGRRYRGRVLFASGFGLITAIILLGLVEWALHQDSVLLRYRAVFGVGRAMDKLVTIESNPPSVLLLGDSRMDNGFSPRIIAKSLELDGGGGVFNLGIPGANMNVLYGAISRLGKKGLLGSGVIEKVVLNVDELEFQDDDSLNLGVFLSDRAMLLEEHDFSMLFGTWFRLWGFAPNLKGLREPATLLRFVEASLGELEPWGGEAKANLGYRPGQSDKFQTAEQLRIQEEFVLGPPAASQTQILWRLLELLRSHGVDVAVLYTPLLEGQVALLPGLVPEDSPYRKIARGFEQRGIPQLTAGATGKGDVGDFANPGHLNAQGGERYSHALGKELRALWGAPKDGVQP